MTKQTKVGRISVQTLTALLFSLLIAAFFAQPAAAQSDGTSLGPEAQAILDAINQARQENGLPPLNLSPLLNLAAQNHVDDVIAHGNWGHYGSDGSTVQMRVARVGYPSGWVSENWVAAGSPEQAMNWWLNDWIHRVNILTPYWDEIGVGVNDAGGGFYIFVTDFGNVDGSTPLLQLPTAVEDNTAYPYADIEVETLPAEGLDYTIRAGDTLLGIALRFGLDWQDIALANNLSQDHILQIGEGLRLPSRGGVGGPVSSEPVLATAGKQIHRVRPGETLWTVAARYGVAWEEIAAVNGLGETDFLQIDQELRLPASLDEPEPTSADEAPAVTADQPASVTEPTRKTTDGAKAAMPTATADPASETPPSADDGYTQEKAASQRYTVRSGDTLLGIALQYDLTWQALADANDLTATSFLQIGQELAVPAGEAVASASTTTSASIQQSFSLARVHTVERGDTLFGIALQYDVDLGTLLETNGLTENDFLQPAQQLKIP